MTLIRSPKELDRLVKKLRKKRKREGMDISQIDALREIANMLGGQI